MNSIETIAFHILKVYTLETRLSPAEDFHNLPVWEIRAALEAAYNLGRKHAAEESEES